jgi:putative exporter of polyketide antibiotics
MMLVPSFIPNRWRLFALLLEAFYITGVRYALSSTRDILFLDAMLSDAPYYLNANPGSEPPHTLSQITI